MSDEQDDEVRCVCGHKLVDAIDPPEVQIGDERIRFRRTTDYLACPECRRMYRVTDVAAGPMTDVPFPGELD